MVVFSDNDNNGGTWTYHLTLAGAADLQLMLPGGNCVVLPAKPGWVHREQQSSSHFLITSPNLVSRLSTEFNASFFHRVVSEHKGVRVYISAYTKDFLQAGALDGLREANKTAMARNDSATPLG